MLDDADADDCLLQGGEHRQEVRAEIIRERRCRFSDRNTKRRLVNVVMGKYLRENHFMALTSLSLQLYATRIHLFFSRP